MRRRKTVSMFVCFAEQNTELGLRTAGLLAVAKQQNPLELSVSIVWSVDTEQKAVCSTHTACPYLSS